MTSRERLMAAVNHKEPDQVAVDLGGATPSSNISAIAYNNLKKELGITKGHTRTYDVVQQVIQPEPEMMDILGIDIIDLGQTFNSKDEDWYDYELADGSTAQYPNWFKPTKGDDGGMNYHDKDGTHIAKMPDGGATFFDQTFFSHMWMVIQQISVT